MKRRSLCVLLTLALALLLGIGSLAGSTVAWFTDSVTSNNKIQSGTLDVEMYFQRQEVNTDETVSAADALKKQLGDISKWKDVELNTELIDVSKLYMPGAVEVVFLQVRNEGNLAMKYQLGITALDTVIAKNAQGRDIRLTEHLQVGAWKLSEEATDGLATADSFASRDAVLAMIENHPDDMHPLKDYNSVQDSNVANGTEELPAAVLVNDLMLQPASATEESAANAVTPASSDIIALVLHMPLTVDNVANYRGEQNPQLALGVHVLAGQEEFEQDSYDSSYDAAANYPAYSSPEVMMEEVNKMTSGLEDSASQSSGQQNGTGENP